MWLSDRSNSSAKLEEIKIKEKNLTMVGVFEQDSKLGDHEWRDSHKKKKVETKVVL